MIQSRLRTSSRRVFVASLLLAVLPPQGRAQYSVLYSNNFESYAPDSYPSPSNPLPGWTTMPSVYGVTPSIVTPAVGSGQALELVSFGGGATGWMLVSSNLLAGSTSDWQVSATTKWTGAYIPSPPYYGVGGLLLSDNLPSDGLTGNWLWIGYSRGDYDGTGKSWSLPIMEYRLGGTNGSAALGGPAFRDFPEHAPIPVSISRTGGSDTISLLINSPIDGQVVRSNTFTGAQATALNSLVYVGFANYYSDWEYDNLSVSVRAYVLTGGAGAWSDTNNWTGGLVASNGTGVIFSGAGGASTNNNLTSVTGLTFSNGAGPYTVSGNAVTLAAAGIANNSGNLQTVANDLTLGTSASFTSASGALAVAGNTALGTNRLTFAATAAMTNSGVISGSGSVVKTGTGTLTLSGANTYSGGTTLSNGVLRLDHASAAGTGNITQSSGSTLQIATTGTVANPMSLHNIHTMQSVTLSGNKELFNATYTVDADTTTTESGSLTGLGGITKQGTGTLIVTGDNSYTGAVAVNEGVLNLNSGTGGAAASAASVSVAGGATLLISQSNQVNNSATVTLSGGTIQRGSGVNETFGALNLTGDSTLDFGAGAVGNLTFGTYEGGTTPSNKLTVSNFAAGNTLKFGSNVGSFLPTGGALSNTYFSFNNGFTYNSSDFTITAIPEPSTYAAAAGLLALLSVSLAGRLPARLQKHRN